MIAIAMLQRLQAAGATIIGRDGEVIGTMNEVYIAGSTDEPSWMSVTTGLVDTLEIFVPLQDAAARDGGTIKVPYTQDFINNAPHVEVSADLSLEEEDDLVRYYQLIYPSGAEGHRN